MIQNALAQPWKWEHSYATLPARCFSRINPTPVSRPRLYAFNESLAEDLGLETLGDISPEILAEYLSGNRIPPDAQPLAMAYGGHQFGHFSVLGDGRAILWGEHLDGHGNRHDIQLKGAGRTPYSRGGDGRAALGPMLREYLISEAMAALNIPTTRSLAVIETGEKVFRNETLPGAILVRTAASHLRVGTFELFAAFEDPEALSALLQYTIDRHYPELVGQPNRALALLETVQKKQINLVVRWMATGFVHGVLNTDNVALSGETIDYGPCAFIDRYHPGAVYSSVDWQGRYAYGNQPAITAWNLARFADSLLPLIHPETAKAVPLAEKILGRFQEDYQAEWVKQMGAKLGIASPTLQDKRLIEDWLDLLEKHRVDFTNGFRALSGDQIPEQSILGHPEFLAWQERLKARLAETNLTEAQIQQVRDAANPRRIPRNHAVQKALDAAEAGNPEPFQKALERLRRPFEPSSEDNLYSATPEESEQVHTTFCGT
ncbi:MAG: YdiU family protein [Opitutales bacterium]|nr:YdiU family protein [Opitutales bacterium]